MVSSAQRTVSNGCASCKPRVRDDGCCSLHLPRRELLSHQHEAVQEDATSLRKELAAKEVGMTPRP